MADMPFNEGDSATRSGVSAWRRWAGAFLKRLRVSYNRNKF